MSDFAVRVQDVSKQYQLGPARAAYGSLRESISQLIAHPLGPRQRRQAATLWALKNVSFDVPHGQVLGLVGPNGAGKSTLLKLLSHITEPSSGRIEIRGRLASLLEVGTGFHPELTGRENIFLNGAILGMRHREIRSRLEAIFEFAEVGAFADTPIKHYSSGMYLRLAFSVAAHLQPDILVVDEVLAVGDVAFQRKCLGKMEEVARGGRTVLFVSHNMGAVTSLCQRAVLLMNGHIHSDGPAGQIVQTYLREMTSSSVAGGSLAFPVEADLPFQLLSCQLLDATGAQRSEFDVFESPVLAIEYIIRRSIPGTHVQVQVGRGESLFLSWDTDRSPERLESRDIGRYQARVILPTPLLKAGGYEVRFGMGIARVRGIHNPDEALRLEITETSVDCSHASYAKSRPGQLVVPLEWRTKKIG